MRRRSSFIWLAASAVSFAVVFGGFAVLASPRAKVHLHVHIRRPLPVGAVAAGGTSVIAEFRNEGCTIVWTGRGGNHSWDRAANWAPMRVPGRDDVACIPRGAKVVITKGANVKRFVNHGDLVFAGGTSGFGSGKSG